MQEHSKKDWLEIEALKQFAEALEAKLGARRFLFEKLCSPPEPDSQCSFDGLPVYVEVTHIYGTVSDAKTMSGSEVSNNELLSSFIVPLKNRIIESLNKGLEAKATKTYSRDRVWLLIRSAFPLWDIDDFQKHINSFQIPPAHPFEQIWLLCGHSESSGLLRLF